MTKIKMLCLTTMALSATQMSFAVDANPIKEHLTKEGYTFVKQIDAPEGLIGWTGYKDEYPSTVFISKDQKYYVVGDLYNATGKNLSEEAINTHVKGAVLDEIWKSLEKSTWIQDGQKDAPRIVYVFSDPNCPYCHKFWQQARPWVNAGKVQLRHIQVGVIREESRAQVASLLMSKDPEAVFTDMNKNKGKKSLKQAETIPTEIADKIDFNQGLMDKYGFFSTPSMVWRDSQGAFQSAQGMPKDLKEIFEK